MQWVNGSGVSAWLLVWGHPCPPSVVALSSATAFPFGTRMFRPRGRSGRASRPSALHFPPPHWEWWGEADPLMIYGENKKDCERIANVTSNPKEWSHSWAIRKPKNTTVKTIVWSDGATSPLSLERNNPSFKGWLRGKWELKFFKWMKLHKWYEISNL